MALPLVHAIALAEVLLGAAVIAETVYDVFESVIVPRPSLRFRMSSLLVRFGWRLWRDVSINIKDDRRREEVMGRFAPLVFVCLLVSWLVLLIVGFGLIFLALSPQFRPHPAGLAPALYYAAAMLLPLSGGGIVPESWPARSAALLASATGIGVVAVVIAFLFQLLGAFQQREEFVLIIGARAGAPPSGVTFLETNAQLGLKSVSDHIFVEGQRWASRVLDTHLAYPLLSYFRSSHVNHSWFSSLGALLDASVFMVAVIRDDPDGNARLFYETGTHLVGDLGDYYHVSGQAEVGVERWEFERACARLAAAGYRLDTGERAWSVFCALRSEYAGTLNAMARHWAIPPAQWIGDRSTLHPRA